jgi:hypothetical protein
MGQHPTDIFQCFWKYHSLFASLASLSKQLSLLHDADIDLTREYTERAHLRSFRPGERIFSQGSNRYFLYIVTLGECEYSRAFPEPSSSSLSPKGEGEIARGGEGVGASLEINIGLTLSSGHFSFMDGSLETEIRFQEGEDENVDANKRSRRRRRVATKEDRR